MDQEALNSWCSKTFKWAKRYAMSPERFQEIIMDDKVINSDNVFRFLKNLEGKRVRMVELNDQHWCKITYVTDVQFEESITLMFDKGEYYGEDGTNSSAEITVELDRKTLGSQTATATGFYP